MSQDSGPRSDSSRGMCPWSVDGFVWHGDPAKVGQFIALRETAGCEATGHGRRDADQELEGSVMVLPQRAYKLIMYISMDQICSAVRRL